MVSYIDTDEQISTASQLLQLAGKASGCYAVFMVFTSSLLVTINHRHVLHNAHLHFPLLRFAAHVFAPISMKFMQPSRILAVTASSCHIQITSPNSQLFQYSNCNDETGIEEALYRIYHTTFVFCLQSLTQLDISYCSNVKSHLLSQLICSLPSLISLRLKSTRCTNAVSRY